MGELVRLMGKVETLIIDSTCIISSLLVLYLGLVGNFIPFLCVVLFLNLFDAFEVQRLFFSHRRYQGSSGFWVPKVITELKRSCIEK